MTNLGKMLVFYWEKNNNKETFYDIIEEDKIKNITSNFRLCEIYDIIGEHKKGRKIQSDIKEAERYSKRILADNAIFGENYKNEDAPISNLLMLDDHPLLRARFKRGVPFTSFIHWRGYIKINR